MARIPFFLLVLFVIYSCSKAETTVTPDATSPPDEIQTEEVSAYLVTAEPAVSHTAALLTSILGLVATDEDFNLQKIIRHKIIYNTLDSENNPIEASGVLFLPTENTELRGIVSLQHSTLQSDAMAPSNSSIGINEYTVGAFFAAIGYLTVLSDHIGYGTTRESRHAYDVKSAYTTVPYDLLLASKDFLNENEIDLPESLYLVGYSNGAFASLALHQYIESQNDFQVTTTFAGAGSYDKNRFAKDLLSQDQDLNFMGTYLWVLDVYNSIYPSLNRSWDTYLQEPYATRLAALGDIRAAVPDSILDLNPQRLFQPSFVEGVLKGSDQALISILDDNSVLDWSPVAPITFYHGTEDDFVFPLNTENALESLNQNGADAT
ncbi:MAG: hypothetical protein L7V31_05860 [Flavobacteriaceae bacterium]|nr:hypothetical protein [Flavobacteriaceae bacterium]